MFGNFFPYFLLVIRTRLPVALKKKLSDSVYSGPSGIHGRGLFACKPIKKGEYIGTYEGPQATRNGTYVLWVYEDGKEPIGRSGRNLLRYLNHELPSKAEFDGFDLYASVNIKPHEEITIDYGDSDAD